MVVLEDILDELETNGATVVNVDVQIDTATITYIDSAGNQQSKKYKIVLNDDGSEDWKELS